jgi:hypothetical protein
MGPHVRAEASVVRERSDLQSPKLSKEGQPWPVGTRPCPVGRRTHPPETRPLTMLNGLNDPQGSEGHRPWPKGAGRAFCEQSYAQNPLVESTKRPQPTE